MTHSRRAAAVAAVAAAALRGASRPAHAAKFGD